jgi:hypothetical protein
MRNPMSGRAAAAVLFLFLAVPLSDLAAQPVSQPNFRTGSSTGIGYKGLMPDALAGVGAWHIFGGTPFGIFADAKLKPSSVADKDTYCPPRLLAQTGECTNEAVNAHRNDLYLNDETEWLTVNAGGMYVLSDEFAIMLGAGVARSKRFSQYVDETEQIEARITPSGRYIVPWTGGEVTEAQATLGLLFRAGPRVSFSFGYETAPKQMAVGLYVIF